jgi:hypothetical protein
VAALFGLLGAGVMMDAERLQVRRIEAPVRRAPNGQDVIDDRGLATAANAEGLALEVLGTKLPPVGVIAPFTR